MKVTVKILSVFLITTAASMAQTPRGLHAPLSHFVVTQKPFADALRALAIEVRWGVAIGFEQANARALSPSSM